MTDFLVQYGLGAWLGRFSSSAKALFQRGERVLVRSSRGVEFGTVLDVMQPAFVHLLASDRVGELLRPFSDSDDHELSLRQTETAQLLDQAQLQAERFGLPLLFLDAEILFDRSKAILQAIHFADCDASPLFAELSDDFGFPVLLHDVTVTPQPESKGCGKPGCGTSEGGCSSCGTGGGCSTGSCASGKVASADEMTKYFSKLRSDMEVSRDRVPLS